MRIQIFVTMMDMILVYNKIIKLSLVYYIFLFNKYNIMQSLEKEDLIKNIDKLCNDLKGQIFLYLPIQTRISLFTDELGTKLLLMLKSVLREYYSIEELYKLNNKFISYMLKEFKTECPNELLNVLIKQWLPSIHYRNGTGYGATSCNSFIESVHPYITSFTLILGIDHYRYNHFNVIRTNMPVHNTYAIGNELFNPSKPILTRDDFDSLPDHLSFKRRMCYDFNTYTRSVKVKVFDTWKPEDIIMKIKAIFNSFTTNSDLDNKLYTFAYKMLRKLYFNKKFKRRFKKYKLFLRERLLERLRIEQQQEELMRRREMYKEEQYMKKFLIKEKRHLRQLEKERNREKRELQRKKKNEELKEKSERTLMKNEDKSMTKAAILKRNRSK